MSEEKADPIECRLFKWKNWNCVETVIFQFYDVELVTDIGDLKKGSKFALATIDYELSSLEFHDFEDGDGDPIERGKFGLRLEVTPIASLPES